MKAFLQKFWHYVLVVLCLIVAGVTYLGYGVKPNIGDVASGNLTSISQSAQDADKTVTPAAAATPAQ